MYISLWMECLLKKIEIPERVCKSFDSTIDQIKQKEKDKLNNLDQISDQTIQLYDINDGETPFLGGFETVFIMCEINVFEFASP